MGLNHGWRGPNIVRDGLVLYLDAGSPNSYQGTGTIWKDISKVNQNNGTLVNGPTFSSANGGSIVFDGVNDFVSSINQPFSIQDNTPFSVDLFFKSTSLTTAQLVGNWNVLVTPGWRIDIVSGQIRFLLLDAGGSSGRGIRTNLTYNNGNIYHYCATYTGNRDVNGISSYINGNSITTTTLLNTSPTTLVNSQITLGASQINTTSYVNFIIGNLYTTKLYNRALTPSEVLQNYNATKGRFGL